MNSAAPILKTEIVKVDHGISFVVGGTIIFLSRACPRFIES